MATLPCQARSLSPALVTTLPGLSLSLMVWCHFSCWVATSNFLPATLRDLDRPWLDRSTGSFSSPTSKPATSAGGQEMFFSLCKPREVDQFRPYPNHQPWYANGSSVRICTHIAYTFLHAWHRFACSAGDYQQNFLQWSSVASLLRVRCWLGQQIWIRMTHTSVGSPKLAPETWSPTLIHLSSDPLCWCT